MKGLFSSHIDVTAKVLDLRLERQNLVAGNLANVDTPGYKARRLEFEDRLQDALALDQRGKVTRTSSMHLPSTFSADGFEGRGIKEFEPRQVFGEDRVDLDKEMALMGKNAMLYNALAEVITKNFQGLQKVIQDGSK
ncbi:flagellar basal-body rod protein FlgB [Paucidesulfovibrio gracilis DSM 16080]|jgi:flagellar basal-body rod protein FlgB|uniref:Flagellar basal body rod protein FlgB n=1 Tax=Paucidesulfovibrio gracilis DSM 16080 TaxID=1121449 RepID=A0A1T4W190_9BACT|nr:flagellar basal body rod protein FlgB [Paucidesulfovibrio gracilis]SKA70808.1 flagellar basal-body rod protein FlgB [Paucidesulfovibrio gracilis DSM 16080]